VLVPPGSDAEPAGFNVCGNVAREAPASPVGRKSGPRCPHAVSSTNTAMLPRMGEAFNIGKL